MFPVYRAADATEFVKKERSFMQRLVIDGEKKLSGELYVHGAKNSALPLLAACVLARGETVLHNCPRLSDVYAACRILTCLGCKCVRDGDSVSVNTDSLSHFNVPDELMREMRSSIVFLGAILGRIGRCRLSFPGGCELGPRPIDMHISALRQMGAMIKEDHGILDCDVGKGLHGAKIVLSFPSVGATENIILAAVTAKGSTVIHNAAREPEITDLSRFLNSCGARISGYGENSIYIEGVEKLSGCDYEVMPDRIVLATYLSAAAVTGSELTVLNSRVSDVEAILPVFEQMGCIVCPYSDRIYISAKRSLKAVKTIRTMPFPGFPTDAQAVVMAALTKAKGTSIVIENIFSNRFRHVDELLRMGADIKAEGKVAVVDGVNFLSGAKVRATDLRGGAALVVAGLGAQGTTEVSDIKYIDRGYESIENAFSSVGASIKRV